MPRHHRRGARRGIQQGVRLVTHLGTWQCGPRTPHATPSSAITGSSYLYREVEAMTAAAQRHGLSLRDAQDVARNIAGAADMGEPVAALAATAIRHRRDKLGLRIEASAIGPCAEAMAQAWNDTHTR